MKSSPRKKRLALRRLRQEREKALKTKLQKNGNKAFVLVYLVLLAGIGLFLFSTFTEVYEPVTTGYGISYSCDAAAVVDSVTIDADIPSWNTETNNTLRCSWIAGSQTGDPTCMLGYEYYANGLWTAADENYTSSSTESVAKIVDGSANPVLGVTAGTMINKTLRCGGMHETLRIRCHVSALTAEINISCADAVKPRPFINYPANKTTVGYSNITFSCNGTDNTDIDTISLMGNFSGTFQENQSIRYGPLTYNTSANFSLILPTGKYIWGCRINDTKSTNINFTSNYTITVRDTDLPVVNITSPANQSYTSAPSLNFTASDNFTISTCSYTINGQTTSNPTCSNASSIGTTGYNVLIVGATDLTGKIGNASVNFTINALPVVNLSAPSNGYIDNDGSLLFVCNASDDVLLANVTLYHNISQSFGSNQSITSTGNVTANFTVNTTVGGSYTWNCLAVDSGGNSAFAQSNRTVIVDLSPPQVFLNSPSPGSSYANGTAVLISANVTDVSIDRVYASIVLPNSATQQLDLVSGSSYSANFTNTSIPGTYNVTIIANDSGALTNNSVTTNFTILNSSITVNLVSPEDGAETNAGNITFVYNVSSETTINNCSILLSFVLNQSNNSIETNTNQQFIIQLSEGTYTWRIRCSSDYVTTQSVTRSITTTNLIAGSSCGNAVCESDETCNTCSADCGACAVPSSSGSSGGRASFEISLSLQSQLTVVSGQTKRIPVTIKNTGANTLNDITISVSSCPQGWGCGSVNVPLLASDEAYATTLELFVPESARGSQSIGVFARSAETSKQKSFLVNIYETCTLDSQCGENRICLQNSCQPLFDLVITRADSPVKPGDKLDFSYFVWNKVGDSGDYTISYSIEGITSGKEVIYISSNEQKYLKASLNIPTNANEGFYVLKVNVDKEDYSVSAVQNIEILKNAPIIIDLYVSKIEIIDKKTAVFTFDASSNTDDDIPVSIEEKISKDDRVIWQKTSSIQIAKTESLQESVSDLSAGTYQLEIKAAYENNEAKIVRTFVVEGSESSGPLGSFTLAIENIIPLLPIIALVIVVAVLLVFAKKFSGRITKMARREKSWTSQKKQETAKEGVRNTEKALQSEKTTAAESTETTDSSGYEIEEEPLPESLKKEENNDKKETNTEKKKTISEDEAENPLFFDTKKKKNKDSK